MEQFECVKRWDYSVADNCWYNWPCGTWVNYTTYLDLLIAYKELKHRTEGLRK